MGIFGKMFGKKKAAEEDLDLDLGTPPGHMPPYPKDDLGLDEKPVVPETPTDTGLPAHLEEPSGFSPAQPRPQPTTPTTPISTRDVDLLSSKLDTIKALLSSLDQRIANLEKAAGVEQNKKMPW